MGRIRRQTSLVSVIAIAAAAIGLAAPGTAGAGFGTEVCNPTPKTDSSFCVTYGIGASTQQAAAPFTADVLLNDTSTNHSGDANRDRWLDHATIDLFSGGAAGTPILTPSANLPNHLLIAGGTPCTQPSFTDCGGGHGTILARVHDNGFGFNGTYNGTFGIQKIVNVNPPGAGDVIDWDMTVKGCANIGFQFCTTQIFPVEVQGSGSVVADPSLDFQLRTTVNIASGGGGGAAEISLDTGSIHWDSQSDKTDGGGTLAQPKVIARMPLRCGTASGAASVFDVAGTSVSIPQSFTITGCPTALFSSSPNGLAANLNGGASSTPVGGRTIEKWIWDFGDGSTRTTSGPTVSHTYSTYGDHTVKLRVEDSAGAQSTQVAHVVRGTTTTLDVVKTAEKVKAKGAVSPAHPGKAMNVAFFKLKNGEFDQLAVKHPLLSDTSTYKTRFGRVNGTTCKIEAEFPGDGDHLGSVASKTFGC